MAVASLILAIIAILVARASAAYTRKQATEQARVASIEHDRRHDELTPEFKITCESHKKIRTGRS
jgi:archaellum component FlaG (FlaF/FlaG flagellin family)